MRKTLRWCRNIVTIAAHSVHRISHGFTLTELIVVVAIIALLAGLMVRTSLKARKTAQRAQCINHCRQIALGIQLYCNDNADSAPLVGQALIGAQGDGVWRTYRHLVNAYVGVKQPASVKDEIFPCPADAFSVGFNSTGPELGGPAFTVGTAPDFTSYLFNGFNTKTNGNVPGIAGVKLSQIQLPAKTVLCGEAPAFVGFSWHFRKPQLLFNRAQNELAFVDGHVSLMEIYWNGSMQETGSTYYYDPPSGFAYQWSNRK